MMAEAFKNDINSGIVETPWSDDQIASLNSYQKSGAFHPYTGHNELAPEGEDDILIATTEGWTSKYEPTYEQTWAWTWTADWSWKPLDTWKKERGL